MEIKLTEAQEWEAKWLIDKAKPIAGGVGWW